MRRLEELNRPAWSGNFSLASVAHLWRHRPTTICRLFLRVEIIKLTLWLCCDISLRRALARLKEQSDLLFYFLRWADASSLLATKGQQLTARRGRRIRSRRRRSNKRLLLIFSSTPHWICLLRYCWIVQTKGNNLGNRSASSISLIKDFIDR